MFSSSPRLNENVSYHLHHQAPPQHQSLRRPNSNHTLQPSPISRPTTPNPTSTSNSYHQNQHQHQSQSNHLTSISSPNIAHQQRTTNGLNHGNRLPRSPKPSSHRLNQNSYSIDSTSSSEYSLSNAPINNHIHRAERVSNENHLQGSSQSESVSPSFHNISINSSSNNNNIGGTETVNVNGKAIQREILESYLMGMANPVGVGNGNGSRKGSSSATRPPPPAQRPVLEEYGFGLNLNLKAFSVGHKERDIRRKSSNGDGVMRLNSMGVSDGMGGMKRDGINSNSNSNSNSNLNLNSNLEQISNGIGGLGKRRSRSSFISDDNPNHAGFGTSSFSQPLPQGSFNHYHHSPISQDTHSMISSPNIYKASQQSPVPPPPPPRSPRPKSKPGQLINPNLAFNSSPPSSSDYSQESGLHHQGLLDRSNGFQESGLVGNHRQFENRRRSRSLSKIIAHDAAMGEQLRYTLTPPIPMDQNQMSSPASFNHRDFQDGQNFGPSNSISFTSQKDHKSKSKQSSRESKRIRSISTSGLNLDSGGNQTMETRHGHHLLVGSDERERNSFTSSSSADTPSSTSKLKRRSRTSSNLVRPVTSLGTSERNAELKADGIGIQPSHSIIFPAEMNGGDLDSSFDQGSLSSVPFQVGDGSRRKRSNSHCPTPASTQQDQQHTTFLSDLNSDLILSTPTSKVKSRKSVRMISRDENVRESLKGQVGTFGSRIEISPRAKDGNGKRWSDNQEFDMMGTSKRSSFNGQAEIKEKKQSPSLAPVTIENLKKFGSEGDRVSRPGDVIPQAANQSHQSRPRLTNPKSNVLNHSNFDSSSLASVSTSDNNVPSRPPRSVRRASTVQPLRLLSSHGMDGGLASPSLPKSPLSMSVPFDQPSSPQSQDEFETPLSSSRQGKETANEKSQVSILDGDIHSHGIELEAELITHSTDIEEQKRLSSNSMRRKKRNSALSSGKRNSNQPLRIEEGGNAEVPGQDSEERNHFNRNLGPEREQVDQEEEETRAAIEAGERSAAARATVRGRVRRTQFFEDSESGVKAQDLISNTTMTTSQTIGIGFPSQPRDQSTGVMPSTSPSPLTSLGSHSRTNPHAEWLRDQERRLAADDLTSIAQSQTTENESRKAPSESDLESADRIRIHSATASEQGRSTFDDRGEHFNGNSQFQDVEDEGDGDVDGGVEWEMLPSPMRQGIDSAIEMWRRSTESFRNNETLEVGIGMSNAGVALRKLQADLKEEDEEVDEEIAETTQTQIIKEIETKSLQVHHDVLLHLESNRESGWFNSIKTPEVEIGPESENCFSARVEEPELDQFEMITSIPPQEFQMSRPTAEIQGQVFPPLTEVHSSRCSSSAPSFQIREDPLNDLKKSPRKKQPYVWAAPEPSIVNSNSGTTLSHVHLPGSFPKGADALDALDQPLCLYQDGMGSASRSTITNDDSNQHIDFTTGLGLFFNPPELTSTSARPSEKKEIEAPPAARLNRLSCHDLVALCQAAQISGGSDDEDEDANDDDDDESSSMASFTSAEEGEDRDWTTNSRRASRVSISWVQAADNFERQHPPSSRDSVSWRTSIAFNSNSSFHSHSNSISSSDRRRSIVAQEAAASIDRRLSLVAKNHHRASRQFQLASHYEAKVEEEENFLMENAHHLEEEEEVKERTEQKSNFEFEFEMENPNQHQEEFLSNQGLEREQVPALSRPASISTTEDCVEIPTPSFQTVSLPIQDVNHSSHRGSQNQYQYQHQAHSQPQPSISTGPGPGPGDADSDPEDLRLSSTRAPFQKRPSSRRWSAMPPPSNPVIDEAEYEDSHLEQDTTAQSLNNQSQAAVFEKEGSTGIASRRLSRRASVVRKGNERRKSVQSRKRLTALMTSMPLILVEAPNHSSWRSSLPSEKFEHLLSEFGPKEMHRQEVIWELIETEASFVHTVCGVQKVFALPLRRPDGRWINGVPSTVARLFDWLEDIFQFHSKLAVALERARAAQSPVALEVAEAISKLVPKLEVYQPYLMRFEAVTALIEEMLKDEDDVFGEFLKMQMLRPECGSLSFSSFLLKPVQRLMKYPLFFKQLFELTPPNHPDHEATKSLYQTTEQLVRDMNNVKAREEDYATLKDLEANLQGLPNDFHIAIRERKLLRQGLLCCVSLNERDQEALNSSSAPATPRSSPSISSPILTGSSRAQFDGVSAESMSKLMPITNSEFRPLSLVGRSSSSSDPRSSSDHQFRSGRDVANDPGRISIWSNASSFSAASFASDAPHRPSSSAASQTRPESFTSAAGSESSTSMYEQPQRPSPPSRQRSAGPESLSPQLYSLPSSLPSPNLSRRPSMASILLRNNKHEKEKEREMNIQAFVFSDILVLCTLEEEEVQVKQSKSSKKNKAVSPQIELPKPQKYNVLEGVGIGRVLSVTDHSGKLPDRPYLLELVVLPMRHEASSRSLSSGPTSLLLSFKAPAGEHPSFRSAEHNLALWTRALQRSLVTSLKLVKEQSSILSPQLRGANARSSEDSLRRRRDSILSSGLSMASRFPTHVQTAHSDWTRRSKQVTELVMVAARSGDKTSLVGLLQSGLPFPKSPSQQDLVRAASEELKTAQRREDGTYSHQQYGLSSSATQLSSTSSSTSVVGDNVLDEVEEEREERKWWALRLSEVRADVETEREIDRMVEQLRSGSDNRMVSSDREKGRFSSNSSPLLGGNGMASNRWSNVSPGGAIPLGLKNGRKVREGVKVVKSEVVKSVDGAPPLGLGIKTKYYQNSSKENFSSSGSGGGSFPKRRER